jgi:hypothetical protein
MPALAVDVATDEVSTLGMMTRSAIMRPATAGMANVALVNAAAAINLLICWQEGVLNFV